MVRAPAPRQPDTVRVVVDDLPGISQRVRDAARRAQAADRVLELVEPAVPECDHAARARMIRHMDEALDVARRAAPGVLVRVGVPVQPPSPRHPS